MQTAWCLFTTKVTEKLRNAGVVYLHSGEGPESVGVDFSIDVAYSLSSIIGRDEWILTKFTHTQHWVGGTK